MRPLAPRHREAGRRLIAASQDTGAGDTAGSAAAFLEALTPGLENLVGRVGARALEGRAVRLAQEEFPVLERMQVGKNPEDLPAGLRQLGEDVEHGELENALVALVGQLVGLLSSLLGDEITLRLLRRSCPDVELDNVMATAAPEEAAE